MRVHDSIGPKIKAPNYHSCGSVTQSLTLAGNQRIKNIEIWRGYDGLYYDWFKIQFTMRDGQVTTFDASTTTPAGASSILLSPGDGYEFIGFTLGESCNCNIECIGMDTLALNCID